MSLQGQTLGITNKNLIEIFQSNWDKIAELLKNNKVVEIDNTTTTVQVSRIK